MDDLAQRDSPRPTAGSRAVTAIAFVALCGLIAWLTRSLWMGGSNDEIIDPVTPVFRFQFTVDQDRGPEPVDFFMKYHGEYIYLDFTFRGRRYWIEGLEIDVKPVINELPAERVARTKPGAVQLERVDPGAGGLDGVRGSVDLSVAPGMLSGRATEATIVSFLAELDRWGSAAEIGDREQFWFPLTDVHYLIDLSDTDVKVHIQKLSVAKPVTP